MRLKFEQKGEFKAVRAAEAWCRENGISFGYMQAGSPTGLMRGKFDIAKWRNLNAAERLVLDGVMTGNFRDGPVVIDLKEISK